MDTSVYPLPDNEPARLAELRAIDLLRDREPEFDAVVALACATFRVPFAFISMLEENEQWFKASIGLEKCQSHRASAFCNYPIASGRALVVNDTAHDPRFKSNPFVTDAPNLRFYAGVPFGVTPGIHLGTLCIGDTKPRALSADEARQLGLMADIVVSLIRNKRETRAMSALAEEVRQREGTILAQAAALARTKSLFNRASALTKSGAWEWNLAANELTWTDGMYDIHEMPRNGPVSWTDVRLAYLEPGRSEIERQFALSTHERRGFAYECEIVTAKGNRRWVRLSVDVECEEDVVVRRYGVKQDITDQKILWDRMRYLAECDSLTGLSNRTAFKNSLEEALAGGAGGATALLLIDLDGFKAVNDHLGHVVGDACLKQIARRLTKVCRSATAIARLGGDEFAVVLPVRSAQGVDATVNRVLDALRQPLRWRGQTCPMSASIGVATTSVGNVRHSDLLTEADLALNAAKAAGRNTSRHFSAAMKQRADARFQVVRDIAAALKLGQLALFYQPKVHLADRRLAGFEALLRWRRPDGAIVTAGEFEAALADPELSAQIGEWVVRAALDQAQDWTRRDVPFGHIAINLNSSQLHSANFAASLINEIRRRRILPDAIEVEITEGVFLHQDADGAGAILQSLRDAGLRIALDDFGTGYASLVHLRSYPVDIIKIDKSFTQQFLSSIHDHAIVQSTLFLARHLGLDVVAEGIEETDQAEFLRALGCRFGQGYLFDRALSATDAESWCQPATLELSMA